MFFNYGFVSVKKVGLMTLLLAQPMFIQAQEASDVAAEGSSSEQQRTFQFPGWPEPRKVVRKERIPPAPPGPYMSSALSGSVDGPSFAPANKPAIKFESPASPMEAFSPDIPWQSNSKSPDRWKPEVGYRYVKPESGQKSIPVPSYGARPNSRYGNYRYGNNQGPRMNSMNMNGSRWTPSMGMAPQGPYNSRQNFAPVYGPNTGQRYGQRYGRPAMNNNRTNSVNPYYPRSGKLGYSYPGS